MAANTTNNHAHDIFCPDPSAHQKTDQGLSAQASTAALYATQPGKGNDTRDPLGKDGKLSSRSAAASLKYAKPTDLPSFPSHGGDPSAAGSAAMLAKDYKMKDLWQPEQSTAGSKAATKAHKDGGKLDLWQYEQSKNGLSAATLAMRKNTQSPLSPTVDRGYTDAGKNNSLLAATKSTRSSRQRADSTPIRPPPLYPDEQNSARNALSAATFSHRNSVRVPPAKKEDNVSSEANQAARVQNVNMDRSMFGSSPMVQPEVDERKHEAALRASAVSMAKKMYDVQNRARLANPPDDTSSIASDTAHRRNASNISQPDLKQEAMRYITLQDQAHKLAQERLAKVDKDMENSKYREYYGYGDKSPRKSRLSMRGRPRNRAASEGANSDDSDDEVQARRIRRQMSQLNTASTTVSDKQRDDDRARLLKAAEKRVHDRMHDMDEKVFMDTGKPTQAMMDDWESKAREKAEKNRAEREKHPGKTHIGGGKYMDQSEIEAIAAARLKPTLEELDNNATQRREREAEIARKRDQAHTERMEEKIRDDQQKAEFKRIREQDKAAARKEKDERKAAQREEKARKSEDQRKSRDMKRNTVGTATGTDDDEAVEQPQQSSKDKRKSFFGRFTDKLRKDEKPTTQEGGTVTAADKDDSNKTADAPVLGGSSAATDKPVENDDSMYEVSNRDAEGARDLESWQSLAAAEEEKTGDNDSTSHDARTAAAAAGAVGVGGLAFSSTRPREDGPASDVSSISSDGDLQQVETARSDLPLQSPAVEHRPDLERHISTIGSSSGEGSDSDELPDSDDDEDEARGRRGGSRQGQFLSTSTSQPQAEAATAVTEPAVSPLREEEKEREHIPIPVLDAPPKETADDVTTAPATRLVKESPPAAATTNVEPPSEMSPVKAEPSSTASADKSEPAAAAPIVATGPSSTEPKTKDPEPSRPTEKPKDEKRGLRGLISRLKGGDKDPKSDSKLQKSRSPPSSLPSEKGFQGGAKYTSPPKKDSENSGSDTITPVTTTSAGKSAEAGEPVAPSAPPAHIGTDGPIGAQPSAAAATTEAERPASPSSNNSISSFRRHDAASAPHRDLDDVSSSGAEEDDHVRGRSGRARPTLTTTEPSDDLLRRGGRGAGEEGEGEQFEEARDTFDESLAPPAAFAGQAKFGGPGAGGSPVRETKFVERF